MGFGILILMDSVMPKGFEIVKPINLLMMTGFEIMMDLKMWIGMDSKILIQKHSLIRF
jgi:hypothetical protein